MKWQIANEELAITNLHPTSANGIIDNNINLYFLSFLNYLERYLARG